MPSFLCSPSYQDRGPTGGRAVAVEPRPADGKKETRRLVVFVFISTLISDKGAELSLRRAVRDLDEEVASISRVALAHAVLLEVLVEPLDAPRLRQAPVGVEEAVDLAFMSDQSHVEIDFDDEEDADETNSPGAVLSGPPLEINAEPQTNLPKQVPPTNGQLSDEG